MIGFLVLILVVGFVICIVSFSDQKARIRNLEEQVRILNREIQKLVRAAKENAIKPEEKKQADNSAYAPKSISPIEERKPTPTAEQKAAPPEPVIEKPMEEKNLPPIETVISSPTIIHKEPEIVYSESLNKHVEEVIRKEKPPKPKSRTSAEWEALIGGKILNRIGALAIIIGMGFFLKYAIDNNWISETARVCIGFGIGAIMLFGGHYFQKKDFKIFSQGLVGAGLAILYLSVYASFNYYHLVTSQGVAIAMMSVVTAITFWQGFKYNSLIIGLFGWLGGFITPFLFSTGHANETGLFTYIAFLDVALLLIVLKKEKWFVLESLTLLGTIIVYYLWYLEYYSSDQMGITIFFLSLFWLMFLTFEVIRIFKPEKKITFLHQLISIANGGFFFGSICLVLKEHDRWLGLISALIAGIYFLVFLLIKRKRTNQDALYVRYLLSVILLMVVSAEVEFDNFGISIAWAGEALVLSLIASRYKNTIVLYSALVVTALALINFSMSPDAFHLLPQSFHLLFNWRSLALFSVMVSSLGSYLLLCRSQNKYAYYINNGLVYTWVLCLILIAALETNDLFVQLAQTTDKVWASFYPSNLFYFLGIEGLIIAMPLLWFGLRRKPDALLISSIVIKCIAVFTSFAFGLPPYQPEEMYHPFFNMRALTIGLASLFVFIQVQWMNKKMLYEWFSVHLHFLRVIVVAGIFILLTVETRDLFHQLSLHSDKIWARFYDKNLAFAFSAEWILLAIPFLWFGLRKNIHAYLFCGLVISALAVLVGTISGIVPYQPMELFIPLLNMRGLTMCLLGCALFIQSRWLTKKSLFQWLEQALNATRVVFVVVIFTLLTVETRDLFQQLSFHADKTWASFYDNNILSAFSIEWILLSMPLLWIALKRKIEVYLFCSLLISVAAIITATINGVMTYSPLELFIPFLNTRGGAMLLIAACLFIQVRWLVKNSWFDWFNIMLNIMRVVMVVIVFILITMETKDAFEKKIAQINNGSSLEATNQLVINIHNQQQLFISGAWLLYSMLLLVTGIYRRQLNVRIASIIIFGITIAKVFFYDLSNLNSLNRIISFIALGVILLLVSFLYQKFKEIIFAKEG